MIAAYSKSGMGTAQAYLNWRRYSTVAYQSATHGNRYVHNYGDANAANYGRYENVGTMPAGALLVKDSFSATAGGKLSVGPLFLMEKMPAGFNPSGGDWQYTMIMPNGSIFGVTNGKNSKGMQFCIDCHSAVAEDQDSLMFLPEEFRQTF